MGGLGNEPQVIKADENIYHVRAPYNHVFSEYNHATVILRDLEKKVILVGETLGVNGISSYLYDNFKEKPKLPVKKGEFTFP